MECLTDLNKIKENNNSCSRRESLEEFLCSQIEAGNLKAGQKISTEKLAIEWDISKGTVNQSLSILASKGMLIRKPRAGTFVNTNQGKGASTLQSKKNISLILPDLSQPEFLYLSQHLQQLTNSYPYAVSALSTNDSVDKYAAVINEQIEAKVDGIVLIPPLTGQLPVDILIKLYKSKIPVITCFRTIEGFGWPMIRVDQAHNTQLAARHLCDSGRVNIGLVSVDIPNSYNDLIKEYTFINTLDEYGLNTKKSLRITLSRSDRTDIERQMWLFNALEMIENWFKENPEIDGICCLHDMCAWAVLAALSKNGKKIPEDVAIVGNGNMLDFFGFVKNDLTTVDCCYDAFAMAIIDLFNDINEGTQIEPNTVIEIKGKLIERYSTLGVF